MSLPTNIDDQSKVCMGKSYIKGKNNSNLMRWCDPLCTRPSHLVWFFIVLAY